MAAALGQCGSPSPPTSAGHPPYPWAWRNEGGSGAHAQRARHVVGCARPHGATPIPSRSVSTRRAGQCPVLQQRGGEESASVRGPQNRVACRADISDEVQSRAR